MTDLIRPSISWKLLLSILIPGVLGVLLGSFFLLGAFRVLPDDWAERTLRQGFGWAIVFGLLLLAVGIPCLVVAFLRPIPRWFVTFSNVLSGGSPSGLSDDLRSAAGMRKPRGRHGR